MDPFDRELRERAKREPFPIPGDYARRVADTCAALPEDAPAGGRRFPRSVTRALAGIAAALAVCIAVPNVSPAAAAALADIPVLGALVEIVTFREYRYDDGAHAAQLRVPELSGGDAAESVSGEVRAYADQLLEQFRSDCAAAGQDPLSLDVTAAVVTDTDSWFTLRIDATRTQTSGHETTRFYHIDKAAGAAVTLKDLFREDADYVSALSAEVLRQMNALLAKDPEAGYFPELFTAIDPEQSFCWDEDGDLVLVFDEYTVAAGSLGMVEFTIPGEVYAALLR